MDKAFSSNLTDQQWKLIKPLIPRARTGGRPRSTCMRQVLNALVYVNRTGCQWRYLPPQFPPWQTVYDYFWKWASRGLWQRINILLVIAYRKSIQRNWWPTLGIVDSQSVRAHYGNERGYDGFKKVRGRKRHIIVDTQGLIWACDAQSANMRDPHGGVEALHKLPGIIIGKINTILGDAAYVGPFDDYAHFYYGIKTERTKKYKEAGTTLKPKRWIVERTFAWFNNYRRLSRDYEKNPLMSESMIFIAMIQIILHRLAN
jgi:putative transposase